MNVLYKYEIPRGLGTVPIPKTDNGLIDIMPKVIIQNGIPYFYAVVDPVNMHTVDVHTLLIGTGEPLPVNFSEFEYIDTIQQGSYVWHVFILDPNISVLLSK